MTTVTLFTLCQVKKKYITTQAVAKEHDYTPACYLHLKPTCTENIGIESSVGSNELNAAANFRIKVNLSPNIAVDEKRRIKPACQ